MTPRTPTIAEIRASTEVLSPPDASATVVKVGEKFAVKFGHTVSLDEAEALQFLSSNSKVPVPEVYATLVEPETGINFIVMEYINAKSLADLWPSLAGPDKPEITNQLRSALQDLRSLEPPSYLGSLNRQPLTDGVFWTPEQNPATSGPFNTEEELNEGILKRLAETEPQAQLRLLRTLISATLCNHKVKFTHGDLQPKNILVKTSGSGESPRYEVVIIDWEISGWYPEYWEFCNAYDRWPFSTRMARYGAEYHASLCIGVPDASDNPQPSVLLSVTHNTGSLGSLRFVGSPEGCVH